MSNQLKKTGLRRKVVILFAILLAGWVVFLFWPEPGYDLNGMHESLRSLATPYQSVRTGCYQDGNSIGITIVDRNGQTLKLALPVSERRGKPYPRLFIGATHITHPGAVEIPFGDDTRRMLISTIEQYQKPGSSSHALFLLRGSPRDYVRLLVEGAVVLRQRLTR
ncbi:MAG: hypothetical protein V4710_11760 [Verrucomicrobiota bacterium]